MRITERCLENPVAVIVVGLLIALFGLIGVSHLPVQLTPEVERPRILVSTRWRAAAPQEVESEIIEPQEEVLRGLQGLTKMESNASQGRAQVTLELAPEADINRVLLDVMNRLNQVPRYPDDTDEPTVLLGGQNFESAIAWFALTTSKDNPRDVVTYQTFVENVVEPRLERVTGIAEVNAYGGRQSEIRISFDPYRAAAYGIDLTDLLGVVADNKDSSAGSADVGKRRYTLRFGGKYDYHQLGNTVLTWRDGSPVYLKDIARIEKTMVDATGSLSQNGGPAIAINAIPEAGVNVLAVMKNLKAAARELRNGPLQHNGLDLAQVYDESVYIRDSVSMVSTNLVLGMLLAIGVLWFFLRKFRATLMVAVSIPLCLFGAFVFLNATGRTLNTISLAGLAFATGMVLDASIVVLENVVRLRERGEASHDAAMHGSGQVWGALMASTATTVAIFLPVAFLTDVAGQLFADLALTISAAVVISLFVAVTFVPTAANAGLRNATLVDRHAGFWEMLTTRIMALTGSVQRRRILIAGLLLLPVLLVVLLKPSADYLPEGKRNLIRAFILAPPGMNITTAKAEIISTLDRRLGRMLDPKAPLSVHNYWLGIFGGQGGFMGIRARNRDDVPALLKKINSDILADIPDTMAMASRASVFGRFAGGRSVDVDLQGDDFAGLLAAGRKGMGVISRLLPGAQVQPKPGLELAEPELRIVPDDRRLSQAGWTRPQFARVVRALGSGAYVGDYFDGDDRLNMIVRADAWDTPEALAAIPLRTPSGTIQSVGELARVTRTAGPTAIRRVDRRRTLTLSVTPPPHTSLQAVIDTLQREVEPKLRESLPAGATVRYSGQADNLRQALSSMSDSFALAVIILYLLMASLFRSFKDAALALVTLPLATVGGIIGLRLTGLFTFQPMDLLTMIGFIILLGLVVNNAILLVYQARAGEREGLARDEAVAKALRLRLRPIAMSTLTTVFGMLPLLLMPGAGTELYRGLAAVIVGGMATSTVFTLILLPSILRLGNLPVLGREPVHIQTQS